MLYDLHALKLKVQSGFTLIELLAVILIIAIITSVMIPNLTSANPVTLDLAAEQYASAIRFARSESMQTNQLYAFKQSNNNRNIEIKQVDTSTLPWSLNNTAYHPIDKKSYNIQLDDITGADNIISTRSVSYRGSCISADKAYFDEKGIAWCLDPNNIGINHFNIIMTLDAHTRTISLDGITGRVTIQ